MSETIVERAEDKDGNTLEIFYDENPMNPLEDDNLGTMILFHKRYDLGHKHSINQSMYHSWDELKESLITNNAAKIIRRVDMYEHGAIKLFLGKYVGPDAMWDSGQIGYVYSTIDRIKKWFEIEKITDKIEELVLQNFKGMIEEYTEYLNGRVYGYVIKDKEQNYIDSCYGFYGLNIESNGMKHYIGKKYYHLIDKLE